MLLRLLGEQYDIPFKKRLLAPYRRGRSTLGHEELEPLTLIQPLTYMNRSGLAVRRALGGRRDLGSLLVVCDTLDLATGRIRLRRGGSSAGHNGLKSIIDTLDSSDFLRLYIGIGRPERREDVVDYVLGSFSAAERSAVDTALEKAAEAVRSLHSQSFEEVVGGVNGPF